MRKSVLMDGSKAHSGSLLHILCLSSRRILASSRHCLLSSPTFMSARLRTQSKVVFGAKKRIMKIYATTCSSSFDSSSFAFDLEFHDRIPSLHRLDCC